MILPWYIEHRMEGIAVIDEWAVAQRQNLLFFGTQRHKASAFQTSQHPLLELYWLEAGRCNFLIENDLFTLQPGDLVLIPNQTVHSVAYDAASNARLLLLCDQSYLPGFAPELVQKLRYVYRNPDISAQLYGLLRKIELEINLWDDHSGNLVTGYLHELTVLLARNRNTFQNTKPENRHICRILEELNKGFAADVSLTELAQRYHISPTSLSRLFKAQTGLTFQDYLSSLRLKHARMLLVENKHLTVAQVAARSGFNDSNYFSVRFRQLYGLSPLQYRKVSLDSGKL